MRDESEAPVRSSALAAKPRVMCVTAAARERILELMRRSDSSAGGLRIGIRKGGCAGQSYTMAYAEGPGPGDEVVVDGGAVLYVEQAALLFLLGATMDFRAGRMESGFVFDNPNLMSSCGCGESVALRAAPVSELARFDRSHP